MNIEILQECILLFKREVISSGFKRDMDDYVSSLPASQSNIVALRDIAGKVNSVLEDLYSRDLPDAMNSLLPQSNIRPFTETAHNENLKTLIENTEIVQAEFFAQLTQIFNKLQTQIQQDMGEIEKIEQFIVPYLSGEIERISEEQFAIIAIIFNEKDTITSLKQFSQALVSWNRILPIYHQLIKSDPPEDIKIVEVQNGSIDFVVNLNVDVAVNLAELFTIGFKVFVAYLSYKKMLEPIIESFHGNTKLIEQQKTTEDLLLENIGKAVHDQIEKQHKEAKKIDKSIDGTAIPKKIEQVTKLITAHIIKGNDLKLLATPKAEEEGDADVDQYVDQKEKLREVSMSARRELRNIPEVERRVLLETYGKVEEEI